MALTSSSCVSQSCHAVGCTDAASVRVRSQDHTWPAGAYVLEVAVPDQWHTCGITLPDDIPSLGAEVQLECTNMLTAALMPETTCTEAGGVPADPKSCTPVAGHYFFFIRLPGTPPIVDVALVRDGQELLHETRTLAYEDEYPNGRDCGAGCVSAITELTAP